MSDARKGQALSVSLDDASTPASTAQSSAVLPEQAELAPLLDKLDSAIVELRQFKDALDRLDDAKRNAVFALAWPGHPCFETLIDEMSRWANRLSLQSQGVVP